MTREKSAVPGLRFVTTRDLLDEIQRRSLGCMVALVRAEEGGDDWSYALKGSPILLGALSASLSIEVEKKLLTFTGTQGGQHERRNCQRHPGAS